MGVIVHNGFVSRNPGSLGFLERARELARSQGISRTEAMRKLAAEQPKLYQDFLTSESQRPLLSK
jgi:hypothetical protein